jgi:uncharacterized membrane protein
VIEVSEKSNTMQPNADLWIGRVLRLGVWISASLMIAGLIFATLYPATIISSSVNPSLGNILEHIFSGTFDPVTLMFAGLVFLMFTPILRVMTAMIGFAVERDWRFVAVSSIVFLMLLGEIIYSLFV